MQLGGVQAHEVHEGVAHAEPVHAHDPWARLAAVTDDGGRSPTDGIVGHPPLTARFAGAHGEPAVVANPFVALAEGPAAACLDVLGGERRRGAVIRGGAGDPTPAGEQLPGIGELGAHSSEVGSARKPVGCHRHGQQGLVHGDTGRQPQRQVRRRHGVGHLSAHRRRMHKAQRARHGTRGSGERPSP